MLPSGRGDLKKPFYLMKFKLRSRKYQEDAEIGIEINKIYHRAKCGIAMIGIYQKKKYGIEMIEKYQNNGGGIEIIEKYQNKGMVMQKLKCIGATNGS